MYFDYSGYFIKIFSKIVFIRKITLPMMRLLSSRLQSMPKQFEPHLNPVLLVCIGKLSLSTLRRVPICQYFSHFSGFLHHFCIGLSCHQSTCTLLSKKIGQGGTVEFVIGRAATYGLAEQQLCCSANPYVAGD